MELNFNKEIINYLEQKDIGFNKDNLKDISKEKLEDLKNCAKFNRAISENEEERKILTSIAQLCEEKINIISKKQQLFWGFISPLFFPCLSFLAMLLNKYDLGASLMIGAVKFGAALNFCLGLAFFLALLFGKGQAKCFYLSFIAGAAVIFILPYSIGFIYTALRI